MLNRVSEAMEIALSREGDFTLSEASTLAREVHAEGTPASAAPRSRQTGASDAGGPDRSLPRTYLRHARQEGS